MYTPLLSAIHMYKHCESLSEFSNSSSCTSSQFSFIILCSPVGICVRRLKTRPDHTYYIVGYIKTIKKKENPIAS